MQSGVSKRWAAMNQLEISLNRVQTTFKVPEGTVINRILAVSCSFYWSGRPGSNRRHSAWEADVLPLNYSRNLFKYNDLKRIIAFVNTI
jgi:hypothetical protein